MGSRCKFFFTHLLISLTVALSVVGVLYSCWYPQPLAQAAGVNPIFLMLLAIDVVIGPVLGFLVYKEAKKTLKMDLSVIILLQVSAFLYGFYSIAQGRPVYIAYVVDRFQLVRNHELIQEDLNQVLPQFRHRSWLRPEYVATEFSKDIKTRNDDMFEASLGGASIAQKPARYVDFAQAKSQIQQRAHDLRLLTQFNSLQQVATQLALYPSANAWLPLKANALDMVVLVNRKNGEVVKIVDLRPW